MSVIKTRGYEMNSFRSRPPKRASISLLNFLQRSFSWKEGYYLRVLVEGRGEMRAERGFASIYLNLGGKVNPAA